MQDRYFYISNAGIVKMSKLKSYKFKSEKLLEKVFPWLEIGDLWYMPAKGLGSTFFIKMEDGWIRVNEGHWQAENKF
jgi:hypothetical protein